MRWRRLSALGAAPGAAPASGPAAMAAARSLDLLLGATATATRTAVGTETATTTGTGPEAATATATATAAGTGTEAAGGRDNVAGTACPTLNPSPPLAQRAVGGGIRAMIPLQAALAARAGAPGSALAVMALVPLARTLARKVNPT